MRLLRTLGAAAAVSLVLGQAHAAPASGSTTTQVTSGHARFEFLTPSLVRMEFSPGGRFVDAPTAVVKERNWPAVRVTTTHAGGWLIVESSALTLRYRTDAGAFTAADLSVSWRGPAGGDRHWRPGQADPGNLGGLTYSLDNISAATLPPPGDDLGSPIHDIIPGIDVLLEPATPGLLSRSGYAFLDDSASPVWKADHSWIEPRAGAKGQDWYLFTYDRDYRKPLAEYARLCGPVPMIPRYALGPWITDLNFEYFPGTPEARSPAMRRYGERHLESEVARLLQNGIPLSGLVLDFAWHNYGWQGGYDWSPLVPHPRQLIDWLHARGLKLSLNDHPGYANTRESSLSYSDSHAPEVLRALGRPLPPAPGYDQSLAGAWKFSPDPHDAGLAGRWYASGYDDSRWRQIRVDTSWRHQGYPDYQGVGWYRASFRLPATLPQTLYLYLGEVAGPYRLFVNGKEVQHSHVQWPRRLTYADVKAALHPGQRNVMALRIEPPPPGRSPGILRNPVALRDVAPPPRIYLDLADRKQADISMRDLHAPLIRQGMDFWWVDGGGGAAQMPGLDPQLWTNEVFYDATERQTGKRAFILGRYGGWGSERYPGYFTGDTYSEWRVLAYEVAYTARGGNVLVPYISNDIGGFHGARVPFDLYARWIEFGTFSPILRMHGAHENPWEGNTRMPWAYGPEGVALMRKYFTLRMRLLPYLYTYAWQAHERSMPLMRPLYLEWPDLDQAYRHFHEYCFGREMLVAPVLQAGGERTVYLPPGSWMDFFTGEHHQGNTTFTAHYAVDATPVFVREGAIIPEQTVALGHGSTAAAGLTVNVYGNGNGRFDLYEDDGVSLDYEHGGYALTPMTYHSSGGSHRLVIGPATGSFAGQKPQRRYEVRIHASVRPRSIAVNGRRTAHWRWNAHDSTAYLRLPIESIRRALTVTW
ncbi:MAG TPA: TIM-barrel domain-containing protein [Steroidobacteraceae bacterium]|nr:TIM-barrel domain-containing protein [Steroidobacteraceae bacterium]